MSPADLEEFSTWIRVERKGIRYRKRTVKRFTAWILDEPTRDGFPWEIVEDVTGVQIMWGEAGRETIKPDDVDDVLRAQGRTCLTPAQLQAALDPMIENMWRVVQVRRTGELPQVDPNR